MLSANSANKLLQANVKNIAEKIKQGKTLSAYELRILEDSKKTEAEQPSQFAKNITELSEILGVPRKTIYEWRRKPDSPSTEKGKIPINEWKQYAEGKRTRQQSKHSVEELNAERIRAQIDNLLIKNQRMLGELIERETVVKFLEAMGSVCRKVISQSGLDHQSQDRIYEQLETESLRVLHGLAEDDTADLPEADST